MHKKFGEDRTVVPGVDRHTDRQTDRQTDTLITILRAALPGRSNKRTVMSGHLDAPAARQVAVEVELFLELERLVTRVRRARALAVATVRSVNRCNRPTNTL